MINYNIIKRKKNKYAIIINATLARIQKKDVTISTICTGLNTIIEYYNDTVEILNKNRIKLSREQVKEILHFIIKVKNKILCISKKHNLQVIFKAKQKIKKFKLENEIDIDDELTDESTEDTIVETENTMMNVIEFLNLASKLLPEFDGTADNLQRFIDAINIVNTIKETHETTAIELIKTKLKGNARNIITNESSIEQIINTLKNKVKGESVETVTAKMLNVKQNGKTANTYAKEIEELTKSLSNAYITDGLNTNLAEKYATNTAVKAIAKNTTNQKVKLIIESGTFNNIDEAVSKFVNASNDTSSATNNSVFYFNRGNNYNNRPNQFRGRGRGRFNNNNWFNNNNNRNSNNRFNNKNNNWNRNNYRGRGSNNYNNNNTNRIRYTNQIEQENEDRPVVRIVQQGDNY